MKNLDDSDLNSLEAEYKNRVKLKTKIILNKLKKIKKYGQKNSS